MTFQEEQKFTQWWLWAFLIGLTMIPVSSLLWQFYAGKTIDVEMIIFFVAMIPFLLLFHFLELKTSITEETIQVKFNPLVNKTIYWKDVASAELVNYGFVGGWGVRLGTKYGTVYNTSGKEGLALVLKNGQKYCIGTQRSDELEDYLKSIS